MSVPSKQQSLAESILQHFPDAIVKKIDVDNYLDIHIPSINPKKGTHIFFNTAKQSIKIGFYCRDDEFVQKALKAGKASLEEYSQGIRLFGNPEFTDVATAIESAIKLLATLGQPTASTTKDVNLDKTENHTFKKAINAYMQGDLAYVAEYVEAGNPVLQFNGEILITNELISYVSAFPDVNQRMIDLVKSGIDLNESFENGENYTAVHFAAWDGKDKILAFLIEEGAKADLVGDDGFTPLLLAAAGGHQACIEILVKNGANLNQRVQDGNIFFSEQGGTPLTVSFINGYVETALFFIEHGADPYVLLEPCTNAQSPNLFINFFSLVKQGLISTPNEEHVSKILGLVGQNIDQYSEEEDTPTEETQSEAGALDLNAFLKELNLSQGGESEEKVEEVEEKEQEEEQKEEDEDLGYPIISWFAAGINQEQLDNYSYKWQSKSEVYGWVMGISGYLPDWYEDFISDKICPAFSPDELLSISNHVAKEKIIPVINYSPEELYNHVKSVWWIVPFCIWKEEIASFVFIDKNGFYAMFKNGDDEVQIGFIFPWDKVSSLEFETEYSGDPFVNRLTLYQENGGFLTFDEFVGLRDDGTQQGSYLSVVEAIWEARKGTIEASAGAPVWYEGKGGEGFVEFNKPQDLLNDSSWNDPFRPDPSMYGG